MKKDYCIYLLVDPKTKEQVYVGITNNIKRRLAGHVRCAHVPHLFEAALWYNRIADMGHVDHKILESGLTKQEAMEREKYWIAKKWYEGHALMNTNSNPGGIEVRERTINTKWYKEWKQAASKR